MAVAHEKWRWQFKSGKELAGLATAAGLLSTLLVINITYLLATHMRVSQQWNKGMHCNRMQFRLLASDAHPENEVLSAPKSSDAAQHAEQHAPNAVLSKQEATSVQYISNIVLSDQANQPRQPMEHYWLSQPAAQNSTFRQHRDMVANYIKSDDFRKRKHELEQQTSPGRGIVIAAGGRYYLPQAIVLLRILRHYHKCTLPVEIFWHGKDEMDDNTLKGLKSEFGPLEGYDVTQLPYPKHHRQDAKIKGFPMKPYALLHSRFKEAFLFDVDVVLKKDPSYMFEAPLFKRNGNYFWGDIYGAGMLNEDVYEFVGLNKSVKYVLSDGKADFDRYAESGQILFNRAMHLDVLEWAWFLNSFSDGFVYKFMWGDKDTYSLAFGLAGKAHLYQHINVPPAGVFTNLGQLGWEPDANQMRKQGNWWMRGLAHYDHLGEVLLMHRVTSELNVFSGQAEVDEIITPPMPHSWTMYYMGYGPVDTLQRSIDVVNFNMSYFLGIASPDQYCPLAAWSAYWTMRTHGIPTTRNISIEEACSGMLDVQYGKAAGELIRTSGLLSNPIRMVVNGEWDKQIDGGWNAPRYPLLGVPVNQTEMWTLWLQMNDSVAWAEPWIHELHSEMLHDG